ncbi:MAG: hypothetical protein NTV21_04115 [Planctomycetota bacterium]|nr:hypothetical protein [Planctomycetota bacterium]
MRLPALILLALLPALVGFQAPVDLRKETSEAREQRLKALVATESGWKLEVADDYFVLRDFADAKLARELAERAALVLRQVERDLDPPKPDTKWERTRSTLYLYSSEPNYRTAGGNGVDSAFWRTSDASLHLYVSDATHGQRVVERALQSVVVAEYIDLRGGPGGHAPWFLNGLQMHYSSYTLKAKKLVPARRDDFVQLVREMTKPGFDCYVPLERLFRFESGEYNGNNDLHVDGGEVWAEGGSLHDFLRLGTKTDGFQPRWADIPRLYWTEWKSSHDPAIATKLALEGVDLAALERAWLAWVR